MNSTTTRTTAALATLAVTASLARAGNWCDCLDVTESGVYEILGPGIYTKNGSPVGQAWIFGATLNAPGSMCDVTWVAGTNDYHETFEQWDDLLGHVTMSTGWKRWPQNEDTVQLPMFAGDTDAFIELMLDTDFYVDLNDPNVEVMIDKVVVYFGPLSALPYESLGLRIIGTRTLMACCEGDTDSDGVIGFSDLLDVLSNWGPCSGCIPDLDGSGIVDFGDLLVVLSNWGPCI